MRRLRTALIAVVAFFLLRSFVFHSDSPTWLRGTSPFNVLVTRGERKHCTAFANMMGSQNMGYAFYGDKNGPVEVSYKRTRRVADSLVFEGKAARGGRTRLLFHCATANDGGHPGEHKTAMNMPWPDRAEDWGVVDSLEQSLERKCADSATVRFPARRISKRWLVLRPLFIRGDLRGAAIDTVDNAQRIDFGCAAWHNEPTTADYRQFGEFSVSFTWPTRDNPGPPR